MYSKKLMHIGNGTSKGSQSCRETRHTYKAILPTREMEHKGRGIDYTTT